MGGGGGIWGQWKWRFRPHLLRWWVNGYCLQMDKAMYVYVYMYWVHALGPMKVTTPKLKPEINKNIASGEWKLRWGGRLMVFTKHLFSIWFFFWPNAGITLIIIILKKWNNFNFISVIFWGEIYKWGTLLCFYKYW